MIGLLAKEGAGMAIVDVARLPEIERLPGWRGRFFHSEHMTVAHYEFRGGHGCMSTIIRKKRFITCWKANWS